MFQASMINLYRHGGDPLNSTAHPNAFTCGFHNTETEVSTPKAEAKPYTYVQIFLLNNPPSNLHG